MVRGMHCAAAAGVVFPRRKERCGQTLCHGVMKSKYLIGYSIILSVLATPLH